MAKYLSGRFKKTPQSKLPEDRNRYLSVGDAEPNLGDPTINSTEGLLPVGEQYQIVSVLGYSGERYWIPRGGGLIPGSISVYDENYLVGTSNSITQLNFVGAAITVRAVPLGIAATITVFSPGNNQEILFNTNNDFGTSSKLKFDSNIGLLSAGDRITVGAGGTVITTTSGGLVGIGTTNPTQELHILGDLRLTGTIYDYLNEPGDVNQIIVKNNLGGLLWVDQGTIRSGAGGTYRDIQFHNSAGLVDGASNFVFDEVNSRIGIGSTQPKVLLDVLGISSFKGGTTIDNLNVTGVTTTLTLAVSGTTTTRNLQVTGVTTIGFVTGTSAYFTGIVTATKFVGSVDATNLYVTGVSTFKEKVNIDSNLGVTGLTTTQNLEVYQSTTLNRLKVTGISTFDTLVNINNLNVTGVGTFDNIKIYDNNIETTVGNLILNSSSGTTRIDDKLSVTDELNSTSKDTGSIVTQGGVGIEKDLYVGGNLYVDGDIVADSADKVSTGTTTGTTTYYPTFVDSNNSTRDNEFLYTDAGISYNPSTNLLSVSDVGVANTITVDKNLIFSNPNTSISWAVANTDTAFIRFNSTSDSFPPSQLEIAITDNGDSYATGRADSIVVNQYGLGGYIRTLGLLDNYGNTTIPGNLGIGTTNPTSKLQVVYNKNDIILSTGAIPNPGIILQNSGGDGALWLGNDNRVSASLGVLVNNGSVIDLSGKYSSIEISGSVTFGRIGAFKENNTSGDYSGYLSLYSRPPSSGGILVEALRIDSSQRVGIGITNPTSKLQVAGDVTPSVTNTYDLGTSSLKWKKIYANSIEGTITGNADTASQVSTGTTTGTTTYFPTFADSNNSTRENEFLYTDAGISYNPSTNLLTLTNLNVTAIATVDGLNINTTGIGEGDIGSDGGTDGIFGIYNTSNSGTFTFNAKNSGGTNTSILSLSSSVAVVSGNLGIGTGIPTSKLQVAGDVTPSVTNSYDLGTSSLKWDNVYANNFVGTITGNADTATKLETPREIDISGDVIGVGIGTTFDGSKNVTIDTTLSTTGVIAGTYGSSTRVGIITVDTKGRITSASNVDINFGTATVQNADNIRTIATATNASFYPTFVDSNNSTAAYEALYTDAGISYNPSTDLLTVPNIRPTAIQDTSGGTGTSNYVLTANGTGGWTWKIAGTSDGSPAIGGITIQEEGTTVGNQLGITTVNFVGASVTATSPTTGTANITVTAASNVTVTQTGYGCVNPITVTGGSSINIASTSNAYGRKFIQTTTPTSPCDGDIWYDTSGGTTGDNTPAGTVIYHAASAAPTGYLKANGASLSTTTYATLFAAIGYTFGGSGASFNVPDLRGQFIRSWADDGTTYDSGRTFGLTQADDFKSHTHTYTAASVTNATVTGSSGAGFRTAVDANTISTGGTETRPRNIALLACIKY